ncbi:MAG: DUF4105 domain-containing protein [Candidatus Sulfotelmatobacter sp.]
MLWLRRIPFALAIVVALLFTVWAAAALYFDLPFPSLRTPAALLYLIVLLVALRFLRGGRMWLVTAFAGFVFVALWWFSLKPSNHLDWQPDNAKTAYVDINGDDATIHDFRDCDYHTETDYTCHWETRSYNLANLSGVDIFITWWGSPWIAHPIVSFDFGDQGHVAMSIETRDVVGQGYSAIRGFFRQYALTYIASDERDVIRLRTNYRKGEEVYLFRTTVTAPMARRLFLEYLQRADGLHQRPEWYNALTNNCTTNIAVSAAQARDVRTRLDWRILLNGKMDEMMYERGGLVTGGLPLPALKEQAHINAAARDADDARDFSKLVRKGRVGFAEKPSLGDVCPPGHHVEDQGSRTVIPQLCREGESNPHSRFGPADFTFALAFLSVAGRLIRP